MSICLIYSEITLENWKLFCFCVCIVLLFLKTFSHFGFLVFLANCLCFRPQPLLFRLVGCKGFGVGCHGYFF